MITSRKVVLFMVILNLVLIVIYLAPKDSQLGFVGEKRSRVTRLSGVSGNRETEGNRKGKRLSRYWRNSYPHRIVINDSNGDEIFKGDWEPRPGYRNDSYKHLVKYIIDNNSLCSDKLPLVLILVESKHSEFLLRKTWRKYWANATYLSLDVIVAYVLAKSPDSAVNSRVYDEHSIHGDIILLDYIDEYHLLPRKTINALHWAWTYCPRAKFVLKTDSDVMIIVDNLRRLLERLPSRGVYTGRPMYSHPVRSDDEEAHKLRDYIISREKYPFEGYLRYVSGFCVIMSMDVVGRIVDASVHVPVIAPFEDVFIGMCARTAGVAFYHPEDSETEEAFEEKHGSWLRRNDYSGNQCLALIATHGHPFFCRKKFGMVMKCIEDRLSGETRTGKTSRSYETSPDI